MSETTRGSDLTEPWDGEADKVSARGSANRSGRVAAGKMHAGPLFNQE
jgi:hypothetical protein